MGLTRTKSRSVPAWPGLTFQMRYRSELNKLKAHWAPIGPTPRNLGFSLGSIEHHDGEVGT
jgi:hypothetical protein